MKKFEKIGTLLGRSDQKKVKGGGDFTKPCDPETCKAKSKENYSCSCSPVGYGCLCVTIISPM